MRQRLFEAQCLKCQDNAHAAQQEFDKAVLALAAGLLGISLSFIKDIVPLQLAIGLPMLYTSWFFAIGAIILTLASFRASQKAFNDQLPVLLAEYMKPDQPQKPTRAAIFTRWLTYCEAACFLVSVTLTIGFAVLNVENVAQNTSRPPVIKTGLNTQMKKAIPVDSNPQPIRSGEK